MAGFQSVVPAVVGGAVSYANTRTEASQASGDRAAQLEAARRQRAFEREQQIAQRQAEIQARREEREYQRRLQLEAYQREQDAARVAYEREQAAYERELADQQAAEERRLAAEQAAYERELAAKRLLEQEAHEREQAAYERELAMQLQLEREAFEREQALERERTRRAREIYEAEFPPIEADPGLVRERLTTLEAQAEDRQTRARDLAAGQASARAQAAASGISGGGTAKAIQRSLIDRSRKTGERAEARFRIRMDEQDKRHARNLLDAENRRRRAMLGLEAQLESRA